MVAHFAFTFENYPFTPNRSPGVSLRTVTHYCFGSGHRDSNPGIQLGRLAHGHYAMPANHFHLRISALLRAFLCHNMAPDTLCQRTSQLLVERTVGIEPTISTLARSRITTLLRSRICNYTPEEATGFEPVDPQ